MEEWVYLTKKNTKRFEIMFIPPEKNHKPTRFFKKTAAVLELFFYLKSVLEKVL